MKRKLISAALAVAGLFGAGAASAQIVGGVNFSGLGGHLDTTTLAETLVTGNTQVLRGYGMVNTVNGLTDYTGNSSATRLYFTFSYTSQNFTGTSAEFVGGVVNIYTGATLNLLGSNSETNMLAIAGMTPWVQLTGHAGLGGGASATAELRSNGTLTGVGLTFTGSGLLDVNTASFGLADVRAFLNGNSEMDAFGGFADILLTTSGSSSFLNPNDPGGGPLGPNGTPGPNSQCKDGSATAGMWCVAGSADLRGQTAEIPEPGSLALVGLSLVGLGVARRLRKTA